MSGMRMPTPFDAAVTAAPMFGGAPEPQMFSPFNFNMGRFGGLGGTAMQFLLPSLAGSFMNQYGMVPSQFLPTQNLYDQFRSQQYHAQQQRAMAIASARDTGSIHQTILGATRAFQGSAPTLAQQERAYGMAQDVQGLLPTLAMFLGPELVDSLMGSRGSATLMAQEVHRGLRQSRDPISGGIGASGATSGMIASQLFESMYGDGADLAAMRGISAGQAGALFGELSLRGQMGPALGALLPTERMAVAANTNFSPGEQARIAEQTLRSKNQPVTPDTIKQMQDQLFLGQDSTQGKIRQSAKAGTLSRELDSLQELPGVEAMLQAGQADRYKQRLQNLAGVVSAMRDIFGDMGRPDAPMREILNGLDALTQGGLATMSPAALEQTVRTTRNLAEQSGLGVQGMLGLQAQSAGLADQLGLDRSLAVRATQGTAAYAGAARDTMRFDIPTFGGLDPEQVALMDQQMRMAGAASQTGNMLNASIRMLQEGLVTEDSDAGRLAKALMTNKTTFKDRQGQERSVIMNNSEWLKFMDSAGANKAAAEAVIADTFTNQRYGRDFNTVDLTRRLQRDIDIVPRLTSVFANALTPQLRTSGTEAVLQRQGYDQDKQADFTQSVGYRLGQQFFRMSSATARDPEAKRKYMANAYREAVRQTVYSDAIGAGRDAKEATRRADEAVATISDEAANAASITMLARLNQSILVDPKWQGFRSDVGMHQMHNEVTQNQQQTRLVEAESVGRMQAAYSRLGRADPIRRLIDSVQSVQPGDDFGKLFSRIMGGIPIEAQSSLQQGPMGAVLEAQKVFLDAERYTETSAYREETDKEIARNRGQTLEQYRASLQGATGAIRDSMEKERYQLNQQLDKDPAFQERVKDLVRVRSGSLTERGVQQRQLATQIVEGLVTGGKAADTALATLAANEGVKVGDMTDVYFETRLAAAKDPKEKERLTRLRQFTTALHGARTGTTAGQALERAGIVTGTQLSETDVRSIAEIGASARKDQLGIQEPRSPQKVIAAELSQLAAKAGVTVAQLRKNEGVTDTTITAKVKQLLDEEAKLKPDAKPAAAETQRYETEKKQAMDTSARFLQRSRDMAETLLASPVDMEQLGQGGIGRVQQLQAREQRIAEMASTIGVSPAQLLAGQVPDGFAPQVAEARQLQQELIKEWEQIADIKKSTLRAGTPGSAVKEAAGPGERAVIAETAAFLTDKQFVPQPQQGQARMTAEQIQDTIRGNRAEAAAQRLFKTLPAEQRERFISDGKLTASGTEIVNLLKTTERTTPVVQAVQARTQLLRMAAEQGILVEGKPISADKLDALTGAQQQEAIDNLLLKQATAAGMEFAGKPLTAETAAKLTPEQRQQVLQEYSKRQPVTAAEIDTQQLLKLQEPLQGIGRDNALTLDNLKKRVESFNGTVRSTADAAAKSTVRLEGTVRIVNPDMLAIAGNARGDGGLEHNGVFTNLLGASGVNV